MKQLLQGSKLVRNITKMQAMTKKMSNIARFKKGGEQEKKQSF